MLNSLNTITMKHKFYFGAFFLFIIFFSTAGCKKHKTDNLIDKLPPPTQEGKNTLGFLLNGQPWTPKGFNGSATNLSLYYDPSFRGGVFNIYSYRRFDQNGGLRQSFSIASDSIQTQQRINVGMKNFIVVFRDNTGNCDMSSSDSTVKTTGFCEISKIDKVNQIFSGIFEFQFIKNGCDTIRITSGRFDLKY